MALLKTLTILTTVVLGTSGILGTSASANEKTPESLTCSRFTCGKIVKGVPAISACTLEKFGKTASVVTAAEWAELKKSDPHCMSAFCDNKVAVKDVGEVAMKACEETDPSKN